MTHEVRYEDWPAGSCGGAHDLGSILRMGDGEQVLLIIPALFDEGNKLRRFTLEVMRRLAGSGVACVLPDLPGLFESPFDLTRADLAFWRQALGELAIALGARGALAMRGGALARPGGLGGWDYAPANGSAILRQMIRARVIAAREAGREESSENLMAQGRNHGLELAGYRLGAGMIADLAQAKPEATDNVTTIGQDMIGGPGLWLRAEPGENREQADALAAIVAIAMKDPA